MRFLFSLTLGIIPSFSFAQQSIDTDSVEKPKYDTMSMDIKSTNSFYFCSKLYKIPRDCGKKNQPNCCSFSSQVRLNEKVPVSGQLGCYDGTSLFWTYFETENQAKTYFESYSHQIKKQMKKFKLTPIKFFICTHEVSAYKLSYTTLQGYKGHEIISYATTNGKHIMLQLHSVKDLNSSNDIQPIFQQIVQF